MSDRDNYNTEETSSISYKTELLIVDILFEKMPVIDFEKIKKAISKELGEIDSIQKSQNMITIAFNEFKIDVVEGKISPHCIIYCSDQEIKLDEMKLAIQHTHGWENVNDVMKKCRYKVVLSDFTAEPLTKQTRIRIFNTTLKEILKITDCQALHWVNSQRLVNPKVFLESLDKGDMLQGPLNVRLFNVEGIQDDMVMDTMGLHVFGLPDIQIHFRNLEPGRIASMLYNYGYYIFENGDVIDDGHTIQGILNEQKWRCQHELSLLSPKRIVLNVNPCEYAAGVRKH